MNDKSEFHNYPKFSILMSVYKNEKSSNLEQSLSSIENQTIIPNEIVLVQDGPIPSDVLSVIRRHQKKFKNIFKTIPLKNNCGLGTALKVGTNFVSTNWIARMDSDDISKPDRFEKQLRMIKSNPNLAVVGGQVSEFVEDTSNVVGQRNVPINSEQLYKFLKWRNPFNHPTVMINKKVLEKVGGYRNFGNLEDYFLWARIMGQSYEVCNLPDILVQMRVDNGLYARRGRISNVRYVVKLRNYLRKQGLINKKEEIIGNVLVVLNIIVPKSFRKFIYQGFLHKLRN